MLNGRGNQDSTGSKTRSAGGSSDGTMHLVQENENLKVILHLCCDQPKKEGIRVASRTLTSLTLSKILVKPLLSLISPC